MTPAILSIGFLAAIAYAVYGLMMKLGAGRAHPYIFFLIVNVLASSSYLVLSLTDKEARLDLSSLISSKALLIAIICGISLPVLEVSMFRLFERNAPASLTFPFVWALGLAFIAVIAVVFLKETLDVKHMIGLVMAIAAVFLLAQ